MVKSWLKNLSKFNINLKTKNMYLAMNNQKLYKKLQVYKRD